MPASTAHPLLAGRRLGFSYETGANLFCRDLAAGVREAATARGVTLLTRECEQSVERQLADIEELLAAGVDVLLVSAIDSDRIAVALDAAQRRGVPVFTVDRAATGSQVLSHIASDNVLGGRLAAEFLASSLGGAGDVAIVGALGATSIAERMQGFRETLAQRDAIHLVAEGNGGADRRLACDVTADLLRTYPRLAAIFACNDVMVHGVLDAVRAAGRDTGVIVVGYDATPQCCEEILRDGPLRAEVAQFPVRMGHTVVDLWADYMRGVAVPRQVVIPVELVTRENVERFTGAERLLRVRRGEVWTAGERVVFFPVRGYQMMLNEIHDASPDLLRHIVYRSGFVLGESIAEQVRELYPDPHDRLFILLEDLSRSGFGTFELLTLDPGASLAEVRGQNLFEAAIAPGLVWVRSPRCVDNYCSGRLAGYLTSIFGRRAVCEEIFCQARGDSHCHFAITAEEETEAR